MRTLIDVAVIVPVAAIWYLVTGVPFVDAATALIAAFALHELNLNHRGEA